MSSYQSLKLICDILSFNNNANTLKTYLVDNNVDWDSIVKIGSKHLILPTLFCRLKDKNLLDSIPIELKDYLEEITRLNRNRNDVLLAEVMHLSNLFNANNINHVFIKGTALLASNFYDSTSERMIGDIDLLVDSDHLEDAFKLVIDEGYQAIKTPLAHKHFEHKHLPRLVHSKRIGAIEIHKSLLKRKHSKLLQTDMLLAKKVKTASNVYHLTHSDLLKHVVYNYQIEDNGHYYGNFSLRSFYDALTILRKDPRTIDINKDKYFIKFFSYLCAVFELKECQNCPQAQFQKQWFVFRLNNTFINSIQYPILVFFKFLKNMPSRIGLFIVKANYRKDVLKERKRILRFLFSTKS